MSLLKPLVWLVLLGGVGYAAYNTLNKQPADPPPGSSSEWGTPPQIQLGGSPTASVNVAPPFAPPAVAPTQPPAFMPVSTGGPLGPSETKGWLQSAAAASPSGTNPPVSAYPAFPTSPSPAASGREGLRDPLAAGSFNDDMKKAQGLLERRQLVEALKLLSHWYGNVTLGQAEEKHFHDLLDQLAGTVVYSREHFLAPAHKVAANERLEDIAKAHHVTAELLGKINGISPTATLTPGSELKVLNGPFTGVINAQTQTLTLFVQDCYAGRFPLSIGSEASFAYSSYIVLGKYPGKEYTGRDGRSFAAAAPQNPLGRHVLDLTPAVEPTHMWLHGSANPNGPNPPGSSGWFSLSPHDAEDVYDILSPGSSIQVMQGKLP